MMEVYHNMLFGVPRETLLKLVICKEEDMVAEASKMLNEMTNIKYRRNPYSITDLYSLNVVSALKKKSKALNHLRTTLSNNKNSSKLLQASLNDINNRKSNILKNVNVLETSYLANIKKREKGKLQSIKDMPDFIKSLNILHTEVEKQKLLINIGNIIKNLADELGPYEEVLGKLARQNNAFKTKADSLSIRNNIIKERKLALNKRLLNYAEQNNDIKSNLFLKMFKQSQQNHSAFNTINDLLNEEIRTMRDVLSQEAKIAFVRRKGKSKINTIAYFYWFLDWVLKDCIGFEPSSKIVLSSSPKEKVKAIIDFYKRFKTITRLLKNEREHLADNTK